MVNFERKYLSEIKSKAFAFCAFPYISVKEDYERAFRNSTWKIQASYIYSSAKRKTSSKFWAID